MPGFWTYERKIPQETHRQVKITEGKNKVRIISGWQEGQKGKMFWIRPQHRYQGSNVGAHSLQSTLAIPLPVALLTTDVTSKSLPGVLLAGTGGGSSDVLAWGVVMMYCWQRQKVLSLPRLLLGILFSRKSRANCLEEQWWHTRDRLFFGLCIKNHQTTKSHSQNKLPKQFCAAYDCQTLHLESNLPLGGEYCIFPILLDIQRRKINPKQIFSSN